MTSAPRLAQLIAHLRQPAPIAETEQKQLIALAQYHHVLPLLSPQLKQPLPAGKTTQLQNLQQLALLKHIAHELSQALIPFIVLKGLPLAQQLYGDIARRPSSDIDLLVPQHTFKSIHHLLEKLGFSPEHAMGPISRTFFTWKKDVTYTHPDYLFKLDLHWRFDRNPSWNRIDFSALWQRRDQVQFSGFRIPVLCPHDTLLYLCQHGAKHGWSRLKWLQDIVDLQKTYAISWSELWQQAQAQHVTRPLLQALMLVEKLYHQPLPFQPNITPREQAILASIVAQAYQYLQQEDTFLGTHGHRVAYHWKLCRYWRYKLDSYRVICWRHATWWQTHRLPTTLFGIVYVLEPLILCYRLLRK